MRNYRRKKLAIFYPDLISIVSLFSGKNFSSGNDVGSTAVGNWWL